MKTSFITKVRSDVSSVHKVHKVNTVKTALGNSSLIPKQQRKKINAALWDETTVIWWMSKHGAWETILINMLLAKHSAKFKTNEKASHNDNILITSRFSFGCNSFEIDRVSVCVFVCVCVSVLQLSWLNRQTYGSEIKHVAQVLRSRS